MAPNELPTEEAVSPTEVAQMQQHHVHESTWAVVLILYKGGSGVKEEVVLLPLVQDWALHLTQPGHGCLLSLTVLWVVLVWEAQQKVEAGHVLGEQEVSYCGQDLDLDLGLGLGLGQGQDQGLGLALEALTFQEVVEEEAQEEVEGKESCLAEQLHQQPGDHFHDQTDKGHQVHKILFHHNLCIASLVVGFDQKNWKSYDCYSNWTNSPLCFLSGAQVQSQ